MRVLVADDDEDLRRLLARRLARRGWDVAVAADGAEAVALARADPPDVIVLDGSMPAMTGPQAIGVLRADAATATLPIVLLSAEEASSDAGADARVGKPFDIAALDALLHRLTGG